MAALERLTVEQVRSGDLLSAHHVHRYEWAAQLCRDLRVVDLACGEGYGSEVLARTARSVLGVDRDPQAVTAARRHFTSPGVQFERSDARAFVRGPVAAHHDVVVCFEGLEHFEDLDQIVDHLRLHAVAGVRLLVSLPNEDKLHADNHFHLRTFAYDDARELAASFSGGVVVQQYLAEGSVIAAVEDEPPTGARAQIVHRERFEPEYANHWLIAVGFPPAAVQAATATLSVTSAPNYNSYMIALERANAELLRINNELRHERLGLRDTAAAAVARRGEEELERFEALRQRYSAPRYRIMDDVRDRLLRVPGLSVSWWGARQVLRRARHELRR